VLNRCSYLFLISILIIILCSCDLFENNDDYNGETTIRGKVIDKSDSTALANVHLTISYASLMGITQWLDIEQSTDSDGKFKMEIYCSEDYAYNLHFSKDGFYNDYPKNINPGKDQYFLIEMRKIDSVMTDMGKLVYPVTTDESKDNYFYIEMINRDSVKSDKGN
jgi:hypothetical protein